jgi:hypothetical protein
MKSLQAEITTWGEERERKKSRKLVFWKFYFNFFLVLTSGRDIKWLWQLFEPSFVKNAFLTLCCSYKKWSHLHIMYYVCSKASKQIANVLVQRVFCWQTFRLCLQQLMSTSCEAATISQTFKQHRWKSMYARYIQK